MCEMGEINIECSWPHIENLEHRTYKEHRNVEIRKHVTTSCSGTKPFYYFWVKGFDIRRRDTLFYAVLFIWPPSRAASIGHKFASRLRARKVDPPRLVSSVQLSNFLQISHKPPRASGAWHHPHPVTPFRHLGLLWHLWVARPPCALVTTARSLPPTSRFAPN